MTVGLFQSSIIVLPVCQSRQQVSYCHPPEIEPSRHRLSRSFPRRRQILNRIFRHEDRISRAQKPHRRHHPQGCSIQFP
jgi:hypothetical protein